MPWHTKYRPRILDELLGQDFAKDVIRGGLKKAREPNSLGRAWVFDGSHGCGKCVTQNTWVKVKDGLRRISDLVPEKLGYTPTKGLEVRLGMENHRVSHLYYGGEVSTLALELQDGLKIEGTPNHPVLVFQDFQPLWKKLHEVSPGDFLVGECFRDSFLNEAPDPTFVYTEAFEGKVPTTLTPDLAYYLGLLVGDGCYSGPNNIGFCTSDSELKDFFIRQNELSFGQGTSVCPDKRSSVGLVTLRCYKSQVYRNWIFSVFGGWSTSTTKDVPLIVRNAPFIHQLAFVQGLMDTDGSSSSERVEIALNAGNC